MTLFEPEERKFLLKANTAAHKHLRNAALKLLTHVEINDNGDQVVPDLYLRILEKAARAAKSTNTALWQHILRERAYKDAQK